MNEKFIINIGRQLGSGGREVGEKLAHRFGISFYDKELINLASEESGLCREFFERADEKAQQSFFGGLLSMRFPFISEGAMPGTNCLSNDSLFKVQSDVIRKLATEKSCLFVGRCADYILRENPRCVNIFISSTPRGVSRDWRRLPDSLESAGRKWQPRWRRLRRWNPYTGLWQPEMTRISVFWTSCRTSGRNRNI